MPINKMLRAAKYGYIILSILICTLGVFLIADPDCSLSAFCWIGGILLILFGCIKILGYVSKDLYRLAFQYDLAFGILLIVLGVIFIFRANAVIHITGFIFGLLILIDSLLKVQIAIDSRTFGIRRWWLILTLAIITSIFGILVLFRPYESMSAMMLLLGISLLGEGILNLTTVLTAVRILKKKAPDQINNTIGQ